VERGKATVEVVIADQHDKEVERLAVAYTSRLDELNGGATEFMKMNKDNCAREQEAIRAPLLEALLLLQRVAAGGNVCAGSPLMTDIELLLAQHPLSPHQLHNRT
jgi:hypothetical protein